METTSNPSLKPEMVSKKISNRRVKTKHTPVLRENSDSSNHVGVNAKPRDHNEIDSPKSTLTRSLHQRRMIQATSLYPLHQM